MNAKIEFSGSIGSNPVNIDSDVRTEIDWEQRRFDLVKAAMQGLSSVEERANSKMLAMIAIEIADAVLAEYQKEEK